MKEKLKGTIKGINIGEEDATLKIKIDPSDISAALLSMRGRETLIIFDDSQATLDEVGGNP